jgi:hypothetical protein
LVHTAIGERGGNDPHDFAISQISVMVKKFQGIRMDPAAGIVKGIEVIQVGF